MTITDHKSSLHSRLAQAYPHQTNGLADGSILIRVDDREAKDSYPGFCDIHLKMSDQRDDKVVLIVNNVPFDADVKSIASELNGTWQTTRTGERLTLNLSASQATSLRRLATAIRKVAGRGRRYLDSNWKWIAPRTCKSLEGLARVLAKA